MDQSGNSGGVEKWADLECPLKVEPVFDDRLDTRCEIEGGIQVGSNVLSYTTKWKVKPLTEMEDTGGREGWWGKQEVCPGYVKLELTNSIQLDMSSR